MGTLKVRVPQLGALRLVLDGIDGSALWALVEGQSGYV
jgi:hypothetical protein